jgi:Ran GTPase-activating protein (RanGAP) involved in mRNA processing and transport
MAWGKTVGVASWVERLKANDASLTSVTVFRGRLFGPDEAAAVSAALRTNTHLLELYASGHAMDAATAATLAEALAENTTLQSLCVGDDAFGDAGLAALAPGVAKSASLRSLDLENKGVGDAGAAALGDALATARSGGCPSLRAINLARNPKLGPEGVAAVCAGAKNVANLTKLILRELDARGVAADAVAELVASARRLAVLDLSGATLDVAAGDIAKIRAGFNKRLEKNQNQNDELSAEDAAPLALELDGVRLGDDGAVALAGEDIIGEKKGEGARSFFPARVSVRGCAVGADGARALARACGASTETLVLRDNALGDAGALAVAAALSSTESSRLASLDLGCVGVGAAGAAAVARAARGVRDLSLFGNASMGNEGLMAFASDDPETSQALSTLKSLDLGGCGADEAGLIAFADALASSAARLPMLETLVVGGNPGTQGDAWEPALARLRESRPGLDVAWRAADAGENPETQEMQANLLAGAGGGA